MVSNIVNGVYTETYDLNTAIGELSLLAVHTPQANALKRMFKGFFEQYRKYRVLGCDFKMVCASRQELTPDLVGLEAGQIDPRDVLNPILFKACTGEHLNVLLDQIYNNSEASANTADSSLDGCSIKQHLDNRQAAINAYYQLLADESFRRSHPQSGLTVSGLRPMVHKVVTTQSFKWTGYSLPNGNSGPFINGSSSAGIDPVTSGNIQSGAIGGFGGVSGTKDGTANVPVNPSVFLSNGLTDMPWLDTTIPVRGSVPIQGGTTTTANTDQMINSVPRVYMGAVILPPAILQSLYFRLSIRWYVQFRDFRPYQDTLPLAVTSKVHGGSSAGAVYGLDGKALESTTYWNIYHTPTSKEVNENSNLVEYSSFETNESAQVDQIMEKVQ